MDFSSCSVDRVCAICQVALYEQVSTSIPGIVALQCGESRETVIV